MKIQWIKLNNWLNRKEIMEQEIIGRLKLVQLIQEVNDE